MRRRRPGSRTRAIRITGTAVESIGRLGASSDQIVEVVKAITPIAEERRGLADAVSRFRL